MYDRVGLPFFDHLRSLQHLQRDRSITSSNKHNTFSERNHTCERMSASPEQPTGPPPRWKDCKEMCPKPEETVKALQDEGTLVTTTSKGKEVQKHQFRALNRLGTKTHNSTMKVCNDPPGLDKNASRGKLPLCADLMHRRKHTVVTETHGFFHKHSKNGMVCLIANDPVHCGIDHNVVLDHFLSGLHRNSKPNHVGFLVPMGFKAR